MIADRKRGKPLAAQEMELRITEFKDADLRAALNRALRTVCIGALDRDPTDLAVMGASFHAVFSGGLGDCGDGHPRMAAAHVGYPQPDGFRRDTPADGPGIAMVFYADDSCRSRSLC